MKDFIEIGSDVEGEYWREEHFLADRPQKFELSLVAKLKNQPVGYAIISRKSTQLAHLHHLMVNAEYRGKGLGSLLLNSLKELVRKKGACKCSLKVSANNSGALRFYSERGFERKNSSTDYIEMSATV